MGCGWGEGKAEVGAAAAADASEARRDQGARPRSETQELGGTRWASARRRRTEAREGGVLAEHGGQRLAPLARHAVVSEVEVRQPLVDLSGGWQGAASVAHARARSRWVWRQAAVTGPPGQRRRSGCMACWHVTGRAWAHCARAVAGPSPAWLAHAVGGRARPRAEWLKAWGQRRPDADGAALDVCTWLRSLERLCDRLGAHRAEAVVVELEVHQRVVRAKRLPGSRIAGECWLRAGVEVSWWRRLPPQSPGRPRRRSAPAAGRAS